MTGGLADLTVAEVWRSPDTAILVDLHLPGVANVALDVVQPLPCAATSTAMSLTT
jgi:hypothetical protein